MAKFLKRILLIHWHFYTHQLIELDQVNFLTGKTGVGKTTIIDALQVVLLGDTNARRFFNKAANDKSERTMEGYLSGEYGEDGDRSSRSLRSGRFSSLIACEFHETESGRIFTVGVVFDSYEIGKWASQWFLYQEPIPEHHFIKDNRTPMDITEFKTWARRLPAKARCQLPASNQQFQNLLAAQLGGLRKNYFSLFRRAVAFTPIQDITSFITNYICDADRSINIHDLKENLRHYRRLEIQAAQIKEQILHLREGVARYADYQNEAANYRLFSFLVRRGEQADLDERLAEKRAELRRAEDQLAAQLVGLADLDGQIEALRQELAGLEQERYGSDLYQKLESLKAAIAESRQVIAEIDSQVGTAINHIRQKTALFAAAADQAGESAQTVPAEQPADSQAAGDPAATLLEQTIRQAGNHVIEPAGRLKTACSALRGLNEQTAVHSLDVPLADQLQDLAGCMKTFTDTAAWSARQLREQQTAAETTRQTCRQQLLELRSGIKQFPNPGIKRLQSLIAQTLTERHGQAISVWIIADELEIADPRWTDALEGYLHTQKFYLLVEPAWFEEALDIYDKAKRSDNLYDIGLIDIERLSAENPVARPGSLATAVRTDNPLIQCFIDYVLGDVICCDRATDLRKHRRAITDSCMLYQNFVARQLNPARYRDRYIGKSAILAQIAVLEAREKRLSRLIDTSIITADRHEAWAALEAFSTYETDSLAVTVGRLEEKAQVAERLKTLNHELAGLDLAWLDRLIGQIGQVKQRLADKEQQVKDLMAQRYQLEARVNLIRDREVPDLSRQSESVQADIRSSYHGEWLQKEAEPRFHAEYKQRENGLAVRNAFYSPQNRSESQKKLKWERVQTCRADFNRLYQASVSVTAESNHDFEQRLTRLEQEKLPDYLDQIRQAKKLAYEQFQSDFLGKLKESIDAVTDSIRELNRTLKDRSWGNERFQFVVEPHPNYRRFYDMIMDDLLMQGYSITYAAFREKHGDTVDELFRQILAVDEESTGDQRGELERNIESYCNYRTYLRFDLHTIDENNEVQRLSRTLRKKSGGETQTPYYIAMLAAFVQLYRIGDRNRSCMRLIIFDEAFSKMDGERIRESIQLLRRIGFQCLISAPPDKIADIAPLVDRNICVLKDRHHSFLAYFDKKDVDRLESELDVDRDFEPDDPVQEQTEDLVLPHKAEEA